MSWSWHAHPLAMIVFSWQPWTYNTTLQMPQLSLDTACTRYPATQLKPLPDPLMAMQE